MSAEGRHFFFTCLDWILPFCNFFRKFGNLVAGFLGIRLSLLAIACSPLNRDVVLPSSWTVVRWIGNTLGRGHCIPDLDGLRRPLPS